MKKKFFYIVFIVVLLLGVNALSLPNSGLVVKVEAASNTTKIIDGKMYLYDASGKQVTKSGMTEVNGRQYYIDNDGSVKRNQWTNFSIKGRNWNKNGHYGRYIYSDPNGKATVYEMVDETGVHKSHHVYLYINGKKATKSDTLLKLGNSSIDTTLVKISDYYYGLRLDGENNIEMTSWWGDFGFVYDTISIDSYRSLAGYDVYDILTGKPIAYFYGVTDYSLGKHKGSLCGEFIDSINKKMIVIKKGKPAVTNDLPPIIIQDYILTKSYNHIDHRFVFTNTTSKKIKYITVNITFINRVGDTVNTFEQKFIGPLDEWSTTTGNNDRVSYSEVVYEARVTKVKIDYMDGSSITLYAKDLPYSDLKGEFAK